MAFFSLPGFFFSFLVLSPFPLPTRSLPGSAHRLIRTSSPPSDLSIFNPLSFLISLFPLFFSFKDFRKKTVVFLSLRSPRFPLVSHVSTPCLFFPFGVKSTAPFSVQDTSSLECNFTPPLVTLIFPPPPGNQLCPLVDILL